MPSGPEGAMASAQPITQASHRGAPVSNNFQQAVSPPSKEQLKSWWTKFGRKRDKPEEQETAVPVNQGIFGVPLAQSIRYANVAISLTNEQGESFIYGYVPIVVAKCGVFLKEKATDVEGIFRLSGSAKRIKDLQTIFNSPDRYGKGLDWTGYTVHDAANILRRYLNQLPEPIVPLEFYEKFRDPLRDYQAKVGNDAHAQAMEHEEHARAVTAYQKLITQLPALNRQLLLYILDLLAVFASKSDLNRMTAQNLAAIFQPGIISHPAHDMAPNEYRLSQDVLIFLIENQDNFLIGMTGTAMDEKTKDEVKSGPPSIKTPKAAIGRSASSASTGSVSVRRTAGVRRNASLSSRASRDRTSPAVSNPGTPVSPSALAGGAGATGGLGRSNTMPPNRSPAMTAHRFQRTNETGQPSTPVVNAPETIPASPTEQQPPDPKATHVASLNDTDVRLPPSEGPQRSTHAAPEGFQRSTRAAPEDFQRSTHAAPEGFQRSTHAAPPVIETYQIAEPVASVTAAQDLKPHQDSISVTPINGRQNRDRMIPNLMAKSPIFGPSDQPKDPNQRQPRKLQKRRIPGSTNESAQSSQASLHADEAGAFHTPLMTPNNVHQERPNPLNPHYTAAAPPAAEQAPEAAKTSPTSREARNMGRNLMPPHGSPTPSQQSRGSVTDPSDFDALDDPTVRKEKRRQLFRLSKADQGQLEPPPPIGQHPGARTSNSSLGSNRPRKSFTGDSQLTQSSNLDSTGQAMNVSSLESAEMQNANLPESEKRGFFGRMKAKMQQSKEQREAEKERAKSPPRLQSDQATSRQSLSALAHEHFSPRGRSFDRSREEPLPAAQEKYGHEWSGPKTPMQPYPVQVGAASATAPASAPTPASTPVPPAPPQFQASKQPLSAPVMSGPSVASQPMMGAAPVPVSEPQPVSAQAPAPAAQVPTQNQPAPVAPAAVTQAEQASQQVASAQKDHPPTQQ